MNEIILQSLGAAETVTGSKHLLKTPELTILGYKYCEIAEQTGIPIGTVKTRIHMGRIQLKQLLKDYDYTA